MVEKVEPSAQNLSELFEVAAVLVCKGYAQGARKALFIACKEIYGREDHSDNTYWLFIEANRLIRQLGLVTEGALVFKGGYSGPCWLDDKSRELLLMSLIWIKTYIDAEMIRDQGQVQQNVTQHYE